MTDDDFCFLSVLERLDSLSRFRRSYLVVWTIHESDMIEPRSCLRLSFIAVYPGEFRSHSREGILAQCFVRFSGFTFLFFLLFTAFFVWQIISYVLSIMRLMDMYRFYTHLLRIPDVSGVFSASSPTYRHNLGRHPNDLLARSRPPHRRNP